MGKKFKSKRKAKQSREGNSCLMIYNSDISVMEPSNTSGDRKSDIVKLKEIAATADTLDNDVPDDWQDRDEEEGDDEDTDTMSDVMQSLSLRPMMLRQEHDQYFLYPTDFWHLLSNYIAPEEVGTFASICRASYRVVASQGFWRRLYHRSYSPLLHYDLPDRLQPDCMTRPRGLRAAVITMLHLTHPPFLSQQTKLSSVWPDPHCLTGNMCVTQSTNRMSRKACYHYFKLKTPTVTVKILEDDDHVAEFDEDNQFLQTKSTRKFLQDLSDIHHNPEEGCRLLQVSCAAWSSLPPVMGLWLLSVSLSVAHGMRHHKLKLLFGTMMSAKKGHGQHETVEIVLDSVCGMKIMDWWHPHYKC